MNNHHMTQGRRAVLTLLIALLLALAPAVSGSLTDSSDAAVLKPAKRSVVLRGPATTVAGADFVLEGRVKRTPKGSPVRLEYSVDGASWKYLWRVRTQKGGRYSYTAVIGRDIAVAYRAVAEKVGKRKAVASPSIVVIGELQSLKVR